MRPRASFVFPAARLAVLAIVATSLSAQSADTALLRRNSSSMFGLPGLVQVPSAAATPSGTVDVTFDNARTPSVIRNLGRQHNAFLVVGFLPWLTVGARGTVAEDTTGWMERRDLSANLSILVLKERKLAPAIAIGAQDLATGATPYFSTRYVVASKTWNGGSTVSAGYGTGPKLLNGLFGGVGIGLGPWVTAVGEFDGHGFNGGARVFPFPSPADRIGIQPRLDVIWRQGFGVIVGAGMRTMIGGKGQARFRPTSTAMRPRPAAPASAPSARDAGIQHRTRTDDTRGAEQRLITLGFENVQVAMESGDAGPVIDVDYENRRFNRDELDALGVVMGVAASYAPDSVRRMRVTIRRVDLPVMTVESDVGAFVAFVNDRLSASTFAGQLSFEDPLRVRAARGTEPPQGNPSRWKLDVFMRPRVETQLLTDLGVASSRVTALADAYLQLGRGLVLNGRRGVPVTQTKAFWGGIEDPNADRLLLHQAMRVPLGTRWPLASALTQFSAGRFGHDAVGFANETDVSLLDGRISLGSVFAVLGTSLGSLDHSVALGTARIRHPGWDLTASLTAGRFRNGDAGVAAELARQFGATELAFYFRSTEFASAAGVRMGLPLAPARELPPRRLRLRAPELYVHEMQASVLDSVPGLRRDVGRLLATDHEIGRVYRTRDRLQPVTVVAHVVTLREAARRWLGAAMKHD